MSHLAIRASAGSGKTYELAVQFIARLHATRDANALLATTFTRKAAGEILDRIMRRLAEAAANPRDADMLNADVSRTGLGSAPEPGDDAWALLLADACRSLHMINVSTIDALFVRVLAGFMMDAGFAASPTMTDDRSPEAAQIRMAALQEVLAGLPPDRTLALLADLNAGKAARSVLAQMEPAVEELHAVARVTDPQAWGNIPVVACPDEPEIEAAVAELRQAAASAPTPQLATALLKTADDAERHDWTSLISTGPCAKAAADPDSVGDVLYYRRPVPPEAVGPLRVLCKAAAANLTNQLRARSSALRDLLNHYSAAYTAGLRERGLLLFNELPTALNDVAERADPAELRYRLGLNVRHLLLDEFQDTAPDQWHILRRLFVDPGHAYPDAELAEAPDGSISVFCVGDSKQAIYGWRGGSARIFDTLDTQLPGLQWEDRATSYRSSQVVLDAVNQVFSNLHVCPLLEEYADVVKNWQAQFQPHTAYHPLQGYVVFREAPQPSGSDGEAEVIADTEDMDRQLAGPSLDRTGRYHLWVAEQVAAIAAAHPACSIGVLVRRNQTAAQIAFAIQSRGVQASLDGPGALADDPATSLVLSAMLLADHPDSTAEAFHVAHSPLGRLLQLTGIGPHERRRASARIRRDLMESGYATVVARWARELAPYGDARTARRLTQLTEAAAAYEPQATPRPADFVRWAREQSVNEPSDARVRVMTIHQAKGLEYDIVVAPELDTQIHAVPPAVLTLRSDADSQPTGVVAYAPEAVRRVCPVLEDALRQHRQAEMTDALNLLYVALTRAKHALYLFTQPLRLKNDGTPRKPSLTFDTILRSTWECSNARDGGVLYEHGDANWGLPQPQRAPEPEQAQPPALEPVTFVRTDRRRLWPEAAPSQYHEGHARSAHDILRLDTGAFRHGTLLHTWLQSIEWLESADLADESLLSIARKELPYESEDWIRTRMPMFREFLQNPTVASLFTKPKEPVVLWRERPFAVRIGGALLMGRMDRMTAPSDPASDSPAIITDFKSDNVTGDAVMSRAVQYYAQMRAYAEAASLMLGVPLARIRVQLLFIVPGIVHEVPLAGDQGSPPETDDTGPQPRRLRY
jgi:ATP-dependent exoDNAse (exonuclease V) beta subunit